MKCPSCGIDKTALLELIDDLQHILKNNQEELSEYIADKKKRLYGV